jgi:succinate dehydrogenase/fumarate reductase flavoprotein subunit
VVIGAGTAGMEAACTAAEVGCHTWLLEENTASADSPARSPAAGEKAYR